MAINVEIFHIVSRRHGGRPESSQVLVLRSDAPTTPIPRETNYREPIIYHEIHHDNEKRMVLFRLITNGLIQIFRKPFFTERRQNSNSRSPSSTKHDFHKLPSRVFARKSYTTVLRVFFQNLDNIQTVSRCKISGYATTEGEIWAFMNINEHQSPQTATNNHANDIKTGEEHVQTPEAIEIKLPIKKRMTFHSERENRTFSLE